MRLILQKRFLTFIIRNSLYILHFFAKNPYLQEETWFWHLGQISALKSHNITIFTPQSSAGCYGGPFVTQIAYWHFMWKFSSQSSFFLAQIYNKPFHWHAKIRYRVFLQLTFWKIKIEKVMQTHMNTNVEIGKVFCKKIFWTYCH